MSSRTAQLALICLGFQVGLAALEAGPATTNPVVSASAPSEAAIATTEIASQAQSALSNLRTIDAETESDQAMTQLEQQLPEAEEDITARAEENSRILAHSTSLDLFGHLESGWRGLSQELAEWNHTLTRRGKQLQAQVDHVQQVQKRWELTREAEKDKIPRELSERVDAVIQGATQTRQKAQTQLENVLRLQNRVSERETQVRESLTAIDQARQQTLRHLLVKDSPSLWSKEVRSGQPRQIAAQSQSSMSRQWKELRGYWSRSRERFFGQVMIFVVLATVLARAHRKLTVCSLTREELEQTTRSLGAPVASALLLTLLLSPWLYSQAPRLWWSLLGTLALVPAIIVLRRLLEKPLFGLLNVLGVFYLLDQARTVAASQPLVWRLLYLAELAAGCLYCWILLRGKSGVGHQAHSSFAKVATATIRGAMALFGLALVADALGYSRFSSLIGNAELSAAYVGIVLYAVVRLGEALVRVVLTTTPVAKLRAVEHHAALLERWVRHILQWTATAGWVLYVLQRLALQRSFFVAVQDELGTRLSIGSLNFTIGHVLLFVVVLWAAYLASRFLRFILEEEVYPHFRLAPGLHYSISKTLHYVVLLVGFLIGLALLGFNLTKLTILAGAFGVGLGFGMQNIVNNFVSGIILLFERPVKVGDVIQLDSTEGVVKRIGIRASIVRTRTGSEIIVPNAKLISDPVTNWTFSQRDRLITMPVAVTSDSEPGKVMDVLKKVAGGHPQVSNENPVQALLTNLNNGTANYELRAWTDQSENWEQVRSDLFTSIKSTLAAEGIAMH